MKNRISVTNGPLAAGMILLLAVALTSCGGGSGNTLSGDTLGVAGKAAVSNPNLGIEQKFDGKCLKSWIAFLDGTPNGQFFEVDLKINHGFKDELTALKVLTENSDCRADLAKVRTVASQLLNTSKITYWLIGDGGIRVLNP